VSELIGEEIYDEFDAEGAHGEPFRHQAAPPAIEAPAPNPVNKSVAGVMGLNFFRSRSAPPRERDEASKPVAKTSTPVAAILDPELPAPTASTVETEVPAVIVTGDGKPSLAAGSGPLPESRPATAVEQSSTPALEAVLLDRKRRLVGSGTPGTIPASAARSRPGPKGKFKSGPLETKGLGPSSGPPTPAVAALESENKGLGEEEQISKDDA
jgi:metal transporter CNNM